jgi:uncharacterized protein (UPF0332 family)
MVKPLDFIETAKRLAETHRAKRPRQADLRRAVSTAYYAVFHAMCRNAADCLIGTSGADRSQTAWKQVYRSVDHGTAKKQCKDGSVMGRFPKELEDFGNTYVDLQEKRHDADYDPETTWTRIDVQTHIDAAELVIKQLRAVPMKDRRAFAAWIVLKKRN